MAKRIVVLGYCDVYAKGRGDGEIVYFREADRLVCERLPSDEDLRAHARSCGVYPSGMPGAVEGQCRPVYRVIET